MRKLIFALLTAVSLSVCGSAAPSQEGAIAVLGSLLVGFIVFMLTTSVIGLGAALLAVNRVNPAAVLRD
jgi:hypothetical protein